MLLTLAIHVNLQAATPGLPFTENFSNTALRDANGTTATWSTEEQEVYLAWQKSVCGTLSNPGKWDIGTETAETYALAVGDVDGDGDLDVVAGNFRTPNMLYLNNGSIFPFFEVEGIFLGTYWTYSVALADMDGDGDLDLVTGNSNRTNKLFLNNGSADPFGGSPPMDIGSDVDATRGIAVGDVDNDGDLDVVAANENQVNRVYLNDGSGIPFAGDAPGMPIGSETDDTFAVALGDMNGDGRLDVVAGNNDYYTGQVNRLYLNNGSTSPFSESTPGLPVGAEDAYVTYAIAVGDMNGDGHLDVVTGNRTYPDVQANRLYLNNGTGDPFSDVLTGQDIGTDDNDQTWSITVGDVDGDGDLDVVAGNYSQLNKLYLNNGTDLPFSDVSNGTPISSDTDDTRTVVLGDMDNDGILDVMAGNQNQVDKLYVNNASENPFNQVSGIPVGDGPTDTRAFALGDFDGDGDLDVVTGTPGVDGLFLNNGSPNPFDGVTALAIGTDTATSMDLAIGDLDRDGDLDLVAGKAGVNKLYLNNGTGNPFSDVGPGLSIGSQDQDYTAFIAVGDLNGDGYLDVVAGNGSNAGGELNRLYLNNRSANPFGGIQTGTPIGANDVGYTKGIALGDMDGDGDLDLVARDNGYAPRLYLNDGSATPFDDIQSGTEIGDAYNTFAIALGDIDADGDLDLIIGNYNVGNRFFLNNGTSNPFSDATAGFPLGNEAENTRKIVLGDVEQDGDLDVIALNYYEPVRLYLNNGTGVPFSNTTPGHTIGGTEPYNYLTIALGDFDQDGFLDAVTANYDRPNQLYLNDMPQKPLGKSKPTSIEAETSWTRAVAVGDVDRDGDLDVVAARQDRVNKLYLNNGGPDPFSGVGDGLNVGTDTDDTFSIALGDVDGDGDLDVVAGNNGQTNKLYRNNRSDPPFSDLTTGEAIGSETDNTKGIALGDLDGNGKLDVVAGNSWQTNKLYLNDGSGNPFDTLSAINIGTNSGDTTAIALADMDQDGDLDVISGDYRQTNKLYLNNRASPLFSDLTSGLNISADVERTYAVAVGDVNRDGRPDVVIGNNKDVAEPHYNRLYLNDGVGHPFDTSSGLAIGSDLDYTFSIVLGDIDLDGDLDVVAGNSGSATGSTNKLYLNNGNPADPFGGAANGIAIDSTAAQTYGVAMADIDGNGTQDIVAGNRDQTSGLVRLNAFNTVQGSVTSKEIDTISVDNISNATLTPTLSTPLPLHTQISYFLSNNGGERFYQVYPGREFVFPGSGNDLRWRAELRSLSPVYSPRLDQIFVSSSNVAPQATAGATLAYVEDSPATPIDATITVSDVNDANLEHAVITISNGFQPQEDVLGFASQNGISGSWNPATGALSLSGTASLADYQAALRSVTYQNLNTGHPVDAPRTIRLVVNDGDLDSLPVTSIVTILRINDAPAITPLDPNLVMTVQNATRTISFNNPEADIYLSVVDPDNNQNELALLVLAGENYYLAGTAFTPSLNYVGMLYVPVIVYDGIDYSAEYVIEVQVDDVVPPWVAAMTRLGPSPTNAGGVDFQVAFSESVSNVTVNDFGLTYGGTLGGGYVEKVTGSGDLYTVTVSGYSGDGTLRLDLVDNDSIVDAAGNPLGGGGSANGDFTDGETYAVDRVAPVVSSITRTGPNPTNAASVSFTVTFSEAVDSAYVDKTDFTLFKTGGLGEGTVSGVSGSGSVYTVTVDGYTGQGTLRLDLIDNNSIKDVVGSGNLLGGGAMNDGDYNGGDAYDIDLVAPAVASIVRANDNPSSAPAVNFVVTFSEDVTGVDTSDFVLTHTVSEAYVTAVTRLDNRTYRVTVSAIAGEGTLRLDLVDDDTIVDPLGIPLGGAEAGNGDYLDGDAYNVDRVAPYVVSMVRADASPSSAEAVDFTVTLNEAVDGVSLQDFTLFTTGTLSDAQVAFVSGGGAVYTVTVSGYTGEGSLRLDLADDDTIKDALGNILGGSGLGNGDFSVGESYEIDRVVPQVVSILRADSNPTTAPSVRFTVTFSEDVTEVDATDFVLAKTGGLSEGSVSAIAGSGAVWTVTVGGYTGEGTLRLDVVDNNSILDSTDNPLGGDAMGDGSYTAGEVYDIDVRVVSAITCDLGATDIILGESLEITGVISPPPSQGGAFVSVTLTPPFGPAIQTSVTANESGAFSYTVACDDILTAGSWTVRAGWNGDAVHKPAVSAGQGLTVARADTRVTVDAGSRAIKLGDWVDISGKFTPDPGCGRDLTGEIEINLWIQGPQGQTDVQTVLTNDPFGHFVLSDYDGFDALGEWRVQTNFAGNDAYIGAISENITVQVVETAGYAIILQGRIENQEGLASHNKTANFVYAQLRQRGLLDEDIHYLNYDDSQEGVDGLPSKAAAQQALTVWARDKMNAKPANLYIVWVDHGFDETFKIYPDEISSSELDDWLTTLQNGLSGQAASQEILVLLGFCRSGSFIDELSGPNRVVITSAAWNESSYKGPLDPDDAQGVRDGEFFITEFFKSVSLGKDVYTCFQEATVKTEVFTSDGTGLANGPFPDDAKQHPLLDDNSDGFGSNAPTSYPGQDGYFSHGLFIGVSSVTGNDPGDVQVSRMSGTQFLGTADTAASFWAKVDDNTRMRSLWLEVKPPGYDPQDGGTEQIEMDLTGETYDTYNETLDRYEWAAMPGFVDPGTYQVFFFARDDVSGNESTLKQAFVYKALAGNTPPGAFDLLWPPDGAETRTDLLLMWSQSTDPDDDPVTYTVEVAKDAAFTQVVHRAEHLSESQHLVTDQAGLSDLTLYYWRVIAVDYYGETTASTSVRYVSTNNTNILAGWIVGRVFDANTGAALAAAAVQVGGQPVSMFPSGDYLGMFTAGAYTITAEAVGYQSLDLANVVIKENGKTTQPIALEPDADGDGVIDDLDGCPQDPAKADPGQCGCGEVDTDTDDDGTADCIDGCDQDPLKADPGQCGCGTADTDTDSDGTADCIDLDDDDDGMPDDWEERYGLDPLVDDADADLDSDGHTNLEEYQGGSDPTDPKDPRPRLMPWLPILLE